MAVPIVYHWNPFWLIRHLFWLVLVHCLSILFVNILYVIFIPCFPLHVFFICKLPDNWYDFRETWIQYASIRTHQLRFAFLPVFPSLVFGTFIYSIRWSPIWIFLDSFICLSSVPWHYQPCTLAPLNASPPPCHCLHCPLKSLPSSPSITEQESPKWILSASSPTHPLASLDFSF